MLVSRFYRYSITIIMMFIILYIAYGLFSLFKEKQRESNVVYGEENNTLSKIVKIKERQYAISKIWNYTFLAPRALAIDGFDNVYVSETYKGPNTHARIIKFDKNGTMLGWFGKGTLTSGYHEATSSELNTGNGNGNGEFTYIFKITFDDQNNMYVIDRNKYYDDKGKWHYSGEERVQRFDSKGIYTGSLITGREGWVVDTVNSKAKIKAAEGDELSCIVIRGDDMLLGSWKKNRIVKINKGTGQSIAWFGKSNKNGYGWHTNMSDESVPAPHFGDEVGAFNGVIDCNVYDNDMYIVSYNSNPVVGVYDYISSKYLRGLSHNDGYKPQEIIVDKDKNLIISDNYEGSIRFLNKDFKQQNKIQLGPGGDYFGVGDFAINSKGVLYFVEQKKEKVYELKRN